MYARKPCEGATELRRARERGHNRPEIHYAHAESGNLPCDRGPLQEGDGARPRARPDLHRGRHRDHNPPRHDDEGGANPEGREPRGSRAQPSPDLPGDIPGGGDRGGRETDGPQGTGVLERSRRRPGLRGGGVHPRARTRERHNGLTAPILLFCLPEAGSSSLTSTPVTRARQGPVTRRQRLSREGPIASMACAQSRGSPPRCYRAHVRRKGTCPRLPAPGALSPGQPVSATAGRPRTTWMSRLRLVWTHTSPTKPSCFAATRRPTIRASRRSSSSGSCRLRARWRFATAVPPSSSR